MANSKQVGAFIFKKRIELGLSLKELAQKLYITTRTLDNWEKGHLLPDEEGLKILSGLFKTSRENILEGGFFIDGVEQVPPINNIAPSTEEKKEDKATDDVKDSGSTVQEEGQKEFATTTAKPDEITIAEPPLPTKTELPTSNRPLRKDFSMDMEFVEGGEDNVKTIPQAKADKPPVATRIQGEPERGVDTQIKKAFLENTFINTPLSKRPNKPKQKVKEVQPLSNYAILELQLEERLEREERQLRSHKEDIKNSRTYNLNKNLNIFIGLLLFLASILQVLYLFFARFSSLTILNNNIIDLLRGDLEHTYQYFLIGLLGVFVTAFIVNLFLLAFSRGIKEKGRRRLFAILFYILAGAGAAVLAYYNHIELGKYFDIENYNFMINIYLIGAFSFLGILKSLLKKV